MQSVLKPRALALVVISLIALGVIGAYGSLANLAQEESCSPNNLNVRNWSTDFCNSNVDFAEILTGNPVKDGIPALLDPHFESVDEAAALGSVIARLSSHWRLAERRALIRRRS